MELNETQNFQVRKYVLKGKLEVLKNIISELEVKINSSENAEDLERIATYLDDYLSIVAPLTVEENKHR